MSKFENDYKILISKLLAVGTLEQNRTGVPAYTLFGENIKIDLSQKILPIVTAKKIFYNKAFHEYIWFRDGGTTTEYLKKHRINWWDKFADSNGNLGKTYGYQLRNYNGHFDQWQYVLDELRYGSSRRAHITLWNPSELKETKLPVCYTGFTFVKINGILNMSMHFRSSDAFLGLPYDIVVGALMLYEIAELLNLRLGYLNIVLDNVHLYENHVEQAEEYLAAAIFNPPYMTGTVNIDYTHGPLIKAPLNN